MTVFLVMLGAGILSPVLPLYAATFGVSYSMVGMVISSFGLAAALIDLPAGSLTDMWGRRPLILVGIAIFGGAAFLGAFAGNIYHLILSRFAQGIGAGFLTTTAMALVADISPPAQRGRYLGYYQGSFFLGTTFGPAIGGFLAEVGGLQTPFFALALLSVAGGIFAQIAVPESLVGSHQTRVSLAGLGSAMRGILVNRNLLLLSCAAASLFTMTSGIRFTALPLYGERIVRLSAPEIGIVLSVAAFFGLLTLPCAGRIVDRYSPKPVLIAGFIASAISSYSFIISTDFSVILGVAAIAGLGVGLANPALAAAALEEADPKHRGLTLGAYRVFLDVGSIAGPLLVGTMSDYLGLRSPFVGVAFLCLFTAIAVYLVLK